MATNQKEQGRDDHDQEGRGNSQENQSNENSGNGIDDDMQRDIASKSGKAMYESSGHAHGFGSKEARKAGRKRSLL